MQTPTTTPDLLQDFECSRPDEVGEKLERFIAAGIDKTHLLFDFDRTMTVSASGDDDATTWQVLQRHLPAEGQVQYGELYQKYRQLEIEGRLTEADASDWFRGVLRLYVAYGVNLNEVETDFVSVVSLRPDTKELLEWCSAQAVPTAILSAGIKDVIEILLKHYDVQADPVVSTQLTTDEKGIITGWMDDTLIHVLNKHEAGHPGLEQIRSARPNCILIGDSMDDASMAAGDTNVLRIRVVDPRQGEVLDKEVVLATTFQKFDLAITTGTLDGISKLLRAIAG